MTEVVGVVAEFTAELFEINQVSLFRNRKLVLNFDSMSTINWVWDFWVRFWAFELELLTFLMVGLHQKSRMMSTSNKDICWLKISICD